MQKSLRCKDSRLGFGILILFGISLARKSAAEQLEVRHGARVGFSGIFNEPLSLRVKQGVITAVGVFVDFAVSYACKALGTGQSFAETTDAGEHIYKSNHRFDNEKRGNQCWLPLPVKYVIFSIMYLPPCIDSILCPIISALESPPKVNLKMKVLQPESHRLAVGLEQRWLC